MPGTLEERLKNLANIAPTSALLLSDYIMSIQGGSIRKITVEDFLNSINSGEEELLREVAWGVTIKDDASSQQWEFVGNLAARDEYLSLIGRYLLLNNGNIAKLSVQNSAVFADGTPLNEAVGHVMFYSPRLYFLDKVNPQTGRTTTWWSMIPIGGKYISASCFAAYWGAMAGSALVSRSGLVPAGSKTIEQFWAAAQVNGKHFGLSNYEHQKLEVMLNLMRFANPNVQLNIGYGIGGSVSLDLWGAAANLQTGATKSLGDACGKIDISVVNGNNVGQNCSRVSLFGIEDDWNWRWKMLQNIYCGSTDKGHAGNEVFVYKGNRMPTAEELASTPNGDYDQFTRLTTSGWIQKMILGDNFDIFPKALGGGGTSNWGDYSYANATGQLVLWGGDAYFGPSAGLGFGYSDNAWTFSYADIGARLAYYGPLNFMSGAELVASL